MAYIGLRKPIIAQRTGDGKYSTPFVLGNAVNSFASAIRDRER